MAANREGGRRREDGDDRVMTEAEREALAYLVERRTPLTPAEVVLLDSVFWCIYDAHIGQVWSTLRRRGLSEADAEETSQEAMLALRRWLIAHGFPADMEALARAIAVKRARATASDTQERACEVALPSSRSEKPASGPDVDGHLDAHVAVREVFPQLAADHRAVLEMCVVDEASHTEAAAALDWHEGTVKTRLIAAKRALAAKLVARLPESERKR